MSKIVFISVVNNFELYKRYILENRYIKTKENIELIHFDNTKENVFISKRYNEFLNNYDYSQKAWFIFCHPDWEILEDIEPVLRSLDKTKIYGPIGSFGDHKLVPNKFSRLCRGYCKEESRNSDSKKITCTAEQDWTKTAVDTLDCQAIIIHSSLIEKRDLKFDNNLEWDLYVEDFCINSKLKYNIETQVIKIECCHHSDAGFKTIPDSYWNMLKYLNKKYPDEIFAGIISPIGGKKVELATEKEMERAYVFNKLRKILKKGACN